MPADTLVLSDNRTSRKNARFFPGSTRRIEEIFSSWTSLIPNAVLVHWGDEITWDSIGETQVPELDVCSSVVVPIQTLGPEPYVLIKPILVLLEQVDDQYIASFYDANISASGDNREEAIFNFKDFLLGAFELLSNLGEDELGPMPLKQRAVLNEYIRPK